MTVYEKVSYVGLQCQIPHQYTQNPPNPHFLEILELPDPDPDDDQKSWDHFLNIAMSFLIIPMVTKSPGNTS